VPPFGPIARRDLIRALTAAGFRGPFSGGRHEFMIRGTHRLPLPNPHAGSISKPLLSRILREAKISREEWELL
jgi:hypothetical protein